MDLCVIQTKSIPESWKNTYAYNQLVELKNQDYYLDDQHDIGSLIDLVTNNEDNSNNITDSLV